MYVDASRSKVHGGGERGRKTDAAVPVPPLVDVHSGKDGGAGYRTIKEAPQQRGELSEGGKRRVVRTEDMFAFQLAPKLGQFFYLLSEVALFRGEKDRVHGAGGNAGDDRETQFGTAGGEASPPGKAMSSGTLTELFRFKEVAHNIICIWRRVTIWQ